jgi:hypothetical protein
MKNYILLTFITILSFNTNAQTQTAITSNGRKVILNANGTWKFEDSNNNNSKVITNDLEILHAINKMTNEEYYIILDQLSFQSGDKRLIIRPSLDEKGLYSGINVSFKNIGNCNENNKLIFLFEDNSKLTLESFNKFNCEDFAYFDLYSKELNKLQKNIISIMFQNGRSYESITVDLSPEDKDYFIRVKKAIDEKNIVPAHIADGKFIKD